MTPLDRALARHADRRRVLATASRGLAGAAALALVPGDGLGAAPPLSGYPFTLGVASGDPTPDGAVLWTRLAPDPLNGGGVPPEPLPVRWRVATDAALANVVRSGTATASPELAHSVHVEVRGLLPGRPYFYGFGYRRDASAVGRFKTAPAATASPARLDLAFCTCQAWDQGFYTLYRDMAERAPDLILHLGDYIYENPIIPGGGVRAVGALPPIYSSEAETLEGYRARYALFKTDPDLQAAHAAAAFATIWDDHEVENNYAGEVSQNDDPVAAFLRRRAAAYQANYEHLPLRLAQRPVGPDLRLHRRLRFGDLLELSLLDTRQYRDDHPCGDGLLPPCAAAEAPGVQMLGAEQEAWLLRGLGRSAARWNVIANGVIMGALDFTPGPAVTRDQDTWDGYAGARARLLRFLRDRRVRNPVVLAGDYHPTFVNDLKPDFADPASPTVAAEFVAPALTTEGDAMDYDRIRLTLPELPHVRYFDGRRHGYFLARVGRQRVEVDFRTVPTVSRPGAAVRLERSFTVLNGVAGVQPA